MDPQQRKDEFVKIVKELLNDCECASGIEAKSKYVIDIYDKLVKYKDILEMKGTNFTKFKKTVFFKAIYIYLDGRFTSHEVLAKQFKDIFDLDLDLVSKDFVKMMAKQGLRNVSTNCKEVYPDY